MTNGDGVCAASGTGIPFAHGRKTESRSNLAAQGIISLATSEAFDPLGRVVGSRQTTAGWPFALAYTYDLADSPLSIAYPSGRVVTTAYDLAERPTSVTGTTVGGATTQYVSGAGYWAPTLRDALGPRLPPWLGVVDRTPRVLVGAGYGAARTAQSGGCSAK